MLNKTTIACILHTLAISLLVTACSQKPIETIPVQEKDFCSAIHRNDSMSLGAELKPVEELMKTKTGVHVLEDGDAAMVARAWLSEYAEKTMDIQYFIFSTDNVGLIACDYIVRAADRGVKVRILIDDMMVEAKLEEVLTLDSHPNIEIRIYNPGVNLNKNICQKIGKFASDFRNANQRMHNKTFTVDGKVCITGGRNLADEYFDYDHDYNFRDRDVLLIGRLCGDVSRAFGNFWQSPLSVPVTKVCGAKDSTVSGESTFARLHQYACNPDNFWPQVREKIKGVPLAFKTLNESGGLVWTDSLFFVSDIPGKNDGSKGLKGSGVCTDSLMSLVRQAKRSIDIQSPYLVTTELGQKLFGEATKRGVKVRILTNSLASTDNPEAFAGYQKGRARLLEAGVRLFEMRPDAEKRYRIMTGALQEKLNYSPVFGLHAKSMVIDGKITVIGTFNIDPRSANLNTECVTVIRSVKISAGVQQQMEEEFRPENAWETTKSWNPDAKAGVKKQVKAMSRKMLPKSIL